MRFPQLSYRGQGFISGLQDCRGIYYSDNKKEGQRFVNNGKPAEPFDLHFPNGHHYRAYFVLAFQSSRNIRKKTTVQLTLEIFSFLILTKLRSCWTFLACICMPQDCTFPEQLKPWRRILWPYIPFINPQLMQFTILHWTPDFHLQSSEENS